MRFASLESTEVAAVIDGRLIPSSQVGNQWPQRMLELIEAGDEQVRAFWKAAEICALDDPKAFPLLADTRLGPPLPKPVRNIICVGKNYREHVNEIKATAIGSGGLPEHPIFFTKATTALTGPEAEIPAHATLTESLDYEGEIAIIISGGGLAISPERAWQHVFGITAINDISARDLQASHRQWFLGKSLDGAAPMGPTILHRSALPPLEEIRIETRVNGETRQQGNLSQLIFDIPTLISVLSAGMRLLPGDIIATGTPRGVGAGFDPPRFLAPGDLVEIEISGVGCLQNRVSENLSAGS